MSDALKSCKKKVECICPRCGEKHTKRLHLFKEDEIPRVYCNGCKSRVNRLDSIFAPVGGSGGGCRSGHKKSRSYYGDS